MRKTFLVLGIVAAVIVLFLAGAWLLIDVNQYRPLIQAQLEARLGRQITSGRMSLGLLPLRFQVFDLQIADDAAFGATPFVRADNFDIRIGLLPLIRGDVRVQSVEMHRPTVELIRNERGVWNFSTLGAGPGQSTASSPDNQSAGEFALDRLSIRDGQLALSDLPQRQARTVYDHIDLTVLNYSAGQPFSFDLAAHIQGTGSQEIRLTGEGGPVVQDNPAATPFRGKLSLSEVGLDGLMRFINTRTLPEATGSLSGESEVTNESGALAATGNLKLEGGRFNGLDVGYPITLDFNLVSRIADGLITINNSTIRLGPTPLALKGSLLTKATPPSLDMEIRSGDISIVEIARLASAFGVVFAPGTEVTGRVSADVRAKGSLAKPALSGSIAGRDLRITGKDIPQPVEVKALDLALSPAAIRSNEFNAKSGKTTVTGQFAISGYTSRSPAMDVALRAPGATLPEIQAIAKAYGLTGLDQFNGGGILNLDMRAAGPLGSMSSTDIIRALNGSVNLDFNPVQVAGFDAAHELAVIGGFASAAAPGAGFTDILRLSGKVLVKNGIAQTDDLQAQLAIGSIAATGTADLATQALDLKLLAVLSKAFTEKVGGTRVGGYMTTALSNDSGELVIPATVKGAFKQPAFAPDLQTFVQMQKRRFLPAFDNPAQAATGLLEALAPKNADPQKESPEVKRSDTIKGILGGLLGGSKTKKKNQ